jgi:ribosomal protein S6
MVILPEELKDNELEDALGEIRAEIKKHNGEVESTTRLGKRAFARKMNKKEGGSYVIVTFALPPDQIKPLTAKFTLDEGIFRVQIVRAPAVAPVAAAEPEGKGHGIA